MPGEHSLRVSLIGKLLRNRSWLGATALGLLGWPLEIVALLLAPLTVVQPCLASGLVVLLWLGVTRLGETPGRREYVAVAAIVAGVAGVAWAAPDRTTDHAGTGAIALALAPGRDPDRRSRTLLRRAGRGGRDARRRQRRLRLRLDGDRQQAAHRRAGGGDAAGRGRLAGDRRRLGGAGAAERDERAAAAPGDPRGAGDVRGPGAGPGDPGAADLRREVVDDARSAAPPWSPSWRVALAGTVAAGRLAGGRRGARDRPRGRLICRLARGYCESGFAASLAAAFGE